MQPQVQGRDSSPAADNRTSPGLLVQPPLREVRVRHGAGGPRTPTSASVPTLPNLGKVKVRLGWRSKAAQENLVCPRPLAQAGFARRAEVGIGCFSFLQPIYATPLVQSHLSSVMARGPRRSWLVASEHRPRHFLLSFSGSWGVKQMGDAGRGLSASPVTRDRAQC